LLLAFLLLIAVFGVQGNIVSAQTDIDVLNTQIKVAQQLSGQTEYESASYFDLLVQINVENLASYYTLVKVHTSKSFTTAIVVGVIGFIFVIAGLVAGFIGIGNTPVISYIATGSGVITEFIAGVFFYLYNRTVRQMKEYHDSLLTVQNILLSFKLVEGTKDENARGSMISQMIAYLMSAQPAPTLTREFAPSQRQKRRIRKH
jgi:phosphate/sulfate permease